MSRVELGFTMNHFYRYSFIFLTLVLSLTTSCDSPHSNPFDPQNPDGVYSKIEGYAKSVTPPYLPVSGVKVRLLGNNDINTETGSSGYFSFYNIELKPCRLIFEKEGYLTDTVTIDWNGRREISRECFLKKLPAVDSFFVYSIVENIYGDTRSYKFVLSTWINDYGSKDIDSVFVVNKELGFKRYLPYNPEKRNYERTFTYTKVDSLEKFIGKNITLSVKNRSGDTYSIGSNFLKRIITDQVKIESPANYEQAIGNPVFKWQKLSPGFNFTYSIQVFTNTIPAQLEEGTDYISSDRLNYSFKDPLRTGEYFWYISCVDEYKNSGQSTPASFVVK